MGDDVIARVRRERPRVAAELDRPHAEEALLAAVVTTLADRDALPALAPALQLPGEVERVLLWGADPVTGTEDLALSRALRSVVPGTGRAAGLEAEPDLVVVTDRAVAVVDATVGRPGHLAARVARAEPVPAPHVAGVAEALTSVGLRPGPEVLLPAFAPARLAAVAIRLAGSLDRAPHAVALGAPSEDLLRPERDDLARWAAHATALVHDHHPGAGRWIPVLRVATWLDLARRLAALPEAAAAAELIRAHPVLAAP
jgi:hypothetical protein